ncbi:MmgE/PrpD family protein [Pseudomonas capeferrum]|uniref:MmgE/PrpD family protein n=1 Tax=Pseudomonas capeferrum TaxID=1495066 RepID=UPI0015E3C4A5|nr:MmgE/PrpD family protein [Pseudomonas capeferrum]MBA1200410.1 MmgE/PrpD family protein [Pseudomonas capeferrum]
MHDTAATPPPVPHLTQQLAGFIEATHWAALPAAIRHEARRTLVNYFAVALAGCGDSDIGKARRLLGRLQPDGQAQVIGRAERLGMLDAASLNAMSANVYDFDDTHMPTIIHPTAPVAAALFAFAETTRVSGEQLLLALVLGIEVECRLGMALHPWHYQRGWHITSTCGVFGAAAAIGKLLGLNARQLAWALGNASAQASGLVETLGSAAKSLGVGNAPRNGILSALLAQEGFAGPARPLEGERGFLRVMGEQPRFAEVSDGLGERWALAANTYKPYPCGVVLNPVIEACLALAQERDWSLERISHIELIGHPLLRERTDRPHIRLGREAQVSAQHAVAVSLATGKAGLAQFSDAAVADPALRALYPRLTFVDDPDYAVEAAQVRLRLDCGRVLSHRVAVARGSLNAPLSDADLENKLRELAVHGGSRCAVQPLLDILWSLDGEEDAGRLMSLASG